VDGRETLGARLDARENGIGALRLMLAVGVLVSHAWLVGGFGAEPLVGFGDNTTTLGTVSVVGFFVLSGMLIARSWTLHPSARAFLRNRALRIMPAFWTCLVVTAAVLGPLCYWESHSTISGYPITGVSSAARYVFVNAGLYIRQGGIAGTLDGAIFRFPPPVGVINGSLWTLFYEAVCYLGVMALGIAGLLRPKRRAVPALLTVGLLLLLVYFVDHSTVVMLPTSIRIIHFQVQVLAAFGIGVTMFCFAERIPMGWVPFAAAAGLTVVALYGGWMNYGGFIPLAYVFVWLGLRLPVRNLEARFDLSYGIYLYAFPIQQLLAIRSWTRWGVGAYIALTIPVVVLAAAASWFLIERPTLRLKSHRGLPVREPAVVAAQAEAEA
jgi:peptidoglycan/LPS O-acetylase OafA/YrhL